MGGEPAGTAGGSARRRYDDLAERDRAVRRSRRGRGIAIVVVGALAAGGIAWLVTTKLPEVVVASTTGAANGTGSGLPASTRLGIAALFAFLAGVGLARQIFGKRQTTEAYRVGAEGEEATSRRLAGLPDGWIVLHDRRIPGSRANIDHVVVGPIGVAVVESKSWSGTVKVHADRLTGSGRNPDAAIDQVLRQVEAVRAVLGPDHADLEVRPVLCIHRAEVQRPGGLFRTHRPRGVRVCPPNGLVKTLTSGEPVLDAAQVTAIGAVLDASLRSAS